MILATFSSCCCYSCSCCSFWQLPDGKTPWQWRAEKCCSFCSNGSSRMGKHHGSEGRIVFHAEPHFETRVKSLIPWRAPPCVCRGRWIWMVQKLFGWFIHKFLTDIWEAAWLFGPFTCVCVKIERCWEGRNLKPKADGNRKVLGGLSLVVLRRKCWILWIWGSSSEDFQRNLGPLELLCPSVRGSLCPCFGLFCWEFGDVKTFGNHTASSAFLLAVYVAIFSRAPKWWVRCFFEEKNSKRAIRTLFLFGYGPKLAKHSYEWVVSIEETQPRVQNFDISCSIM